MAKYPETSIAALFQNQVLKYGDRPCVAYKKGGVYTDISWNDMNDMIRKIGLYLVSRGIKKGDKISIFSPNRYEWWVADQAILGIGAVNVPIYATNSAEEAQYVLGHSDARICFVSSREHLDKVLKAKKRTPKLKEIVIFDAITLKNRSVVQFSDALRIGGAYKDTSIFDKRLKAIKPAELATMIYTSGTTGNPKGVMLSHQNIISNIRQFVHEIKGRADENDVYLSFLPLSHSFERTVGYYIPVAIGAKVAFAEDFSTIQQNLLEVRPTAMVSVPRLYEKIHAGILAKVADAPPVKKALFNWAMRTAAKNLPYACEEKPRTGLFALRFKIADRIIFSKLKAAIGLDRIKFAGSGGGPLAVTDAEFFIGMGIIILEGFGLSETSPITNVNLPCNIKPGSVGTAVKDTIVKIADDGEILIKGPQIMMGYYKNREATKEVFTKDNYFRTGDIGTIDEKGRLYITGRIKDIIVTAGGKNISPQNIENSLKTSKYIEQVAVIGDRRKYLSALVIPAFDELKKWAKKHEIEFAKNSDLISNELIIQLIADEIKKYTGMYSQVEQIRKFKLLEAEWTQQTDELTPTLKVKRRVIEKKYADEIESMYPGE